MYAELGFCQLISHMNVKFVADTCPAMRQLSGSI